MHAPLETTLAPLLRTVKAAMDDFDADCSQVEDWVDTSAAACPAKALLGPLSAPIDLFVFVKARPVREAAACLNLSRGTVHNLQKGYWPADPRKILQRWDAYKGRSGKRATSWFIRRVSADGVRHGGKLFVSSQLAGRKGELLAVARLPDGDLLAQTLELPTERFTLSALSALSAKA